MSETLKDAIAEAMRECWYRGHTYGYGGKGMDLAGVEKWCDEQAAGVIRRAEPAAHDGEVEALMKRAADIIETGDIRLMASDGPCGGLPPDITLKEWRELYLCITRSLSALRTRTPQDDVEGSGANFLQVTDEWEYLCDAHATPDSEPMACRVCSGPASRIRHVK